VAADYRLLAYFHDGDTLFVNLYLPSTLHWVNSDGAQIVLTQTGDYPVGGSVSLVIRAVRPSTFDLRLRIPAWAPPTPTIRINQERVFASVQTGFATLRRRWKDGDRVELELAMPMRLEAIDPKHPDTVALVRGPLVLFPLTDNPPAFTRQLLSAEKVPDENAWRIATASGPLQLRPFFAIEDQRYTTYVNVA
jgi:uncharacterized protein